MKTAIYARYSGDHQRESSIDDQVRNCTAFATREGFSIGQLYQDKAISGAVKARPGYQQMLEDAAAGLFNVLMVDDLSRLSRDDYEMKGVLRKFIWQGLRVIGVSDGYDSSRKGHKIHAGFKGLMNEMFLDDLRDKTHRGMTGQALKGYNCGGRTYGYRNVPIEDATRHDAYGRPTVVAVRYEIDEAQAKHVRQIYTWYAEGYAYSWIADQLNRNSIPASRGGTWAVSGVKVILENEMYEGRLIWNRREWVKHPDTGKRTYKERPKSEWIVTENQELRIVAGDIIEAVRIRQKKNRATYPGTFTVANAQRYLFSGLMVCAECGGNFVISAKGRYGCMTYKTRGSSICSNSITVSRYIVEERLLHNLKQQLLAPQAKENFKREAVKALEAYQHDNPTDALQKQLRVAEKQRDHIMNAIKAGIITASTKTALEEAESSIYTLSHQINHASTHSISGMLPKAMERYEAAIGHLEKEFTGHVSQAREIMKLLIGDRIRIHRRDNHLEAELQNNIPAILQRAIGAEFDLTGCGGRI
jgi:site-specific DNA recombinase